MKVKAKINKIRNCNAMSVPCSGLEFSKLSDGNTVEVKDEIAEKMLAMGIVEKTTTKKKIKGE